MPSEKRKTVDIYKVRRIQAVGKLKMNTNRQFLSHNVTKRRAS